jgi:hypothetical protein
MIGEKLCRNAMSWTLTVKDIKCIKRHGETDSQESRDMNKIQAASLFVAVFTFLMVIVMLFFAATDSKNTVGFAAVAVFLVLTGTFWTYRVVKGRRTL